MHHNRAQCAARTRLAIQSLIAVSKRLTRKRTDRLQNCYRGNLIEPAIAAEPTRSRW